jgi:nucleotide sugar dehydrogenase
MKVAVFGLGYVGSVTAAGLAANGHSVYGVDVDAAKVALIQEGRSPVVEPGLEELIASAVACGRLSATSDASLALDRADVTLICVGTPSTAHGSADLSYITRALDDVVDGMATGTPPDSGIHTLVVRSTVPPGTVDTVVQPYADRMSASGWAVTTAMCPEFLREGSGVADFFNPSLVVVGTQDIRAAEVLTELLGFSEQPVRVVDTKTAEALKYACNAFHATKVSFANDISRVLRPMGVDSRQVMSLLCEDRVLNIAPTYLQPGFAYGGSCLPKDLRSLIHLARRESTDVPLLTGTAATNELLVREVVDRIVAHAPRSVAMLGLSFKSNTDDLRESPNLEVAERLVGKGFDLRIYDPVVNPLRLVGTNRVYVETRLPHVNRLLTESADDALRGADLAVVATSDEATVAALVATRPPRVLDLSGRLGPEVESLVGYEGVGW